jgi:DNA polymerase I-like protein with 3'-5' exonuclease and polymerase domains/5'-3' exonuclease
MKEQYREILDLRGLVFHAYYGGAPVDQIRDEKGDLRPTAVHGMDNFIRTYLQPILDTTAPINIIAVLEGSFGNARRRALQADYKAKEGQDDRSEIITAEKNKLLESVQKLLLGLGAMLVRTPYAEADDTIGYLCQRLKGPKMVRTVDRDLLQLHREGVAVCIRDKFVDRYTDNKYPEGMPLAPYNLVAVYKSIVGDTSDRYVGVRGMGIEAWRTLVKLYGFDGMAQLEECVNTGSYDKIVEALQVNYSKELEKLYLAREEWHMSYRLAKIHPEWCEMSFNERVVQPEWGKRVPSEKRIRDVLEPMGLMHHYETFKRFMPRKWLYDKPYSMQNNQTALLKAMSESRFVAFDYESYDKLKHPAYQMAKAGYVDVLSQIMTGCSFCFGSNMQYSFYMTTKHRDTRNVSPDDVKAMLLALEEQTLIAHGCMFELTVTYTNFGGMRLKNVLDTMIMGSYVNENKRSGLKLLSKAFLNYDQIKYTDVVKPGEDMRDVSGVEVLDYGCDDSIVTAHLAVLFNAIMECEQTWDFYEQNEPYFEQAMLRSFVRGVPLDYDRLDQLNAEDNKLHDELFAKLRGILEEHCTNINDDGFIRLWAEIEPFEVAKLKDKGLKKLEQEKAKWIANGLDETSVTEKSLQFAEVHAAQSAKIIQEKKDKLYRACKYTPIQAPKLELKVKDIGLVRKAIGGLPTIRSIKPEWLLNYCNGIDKQVAAGADISVQGKMLVDMLKAAATLDDNALNVLEDWINDYAQHHTELWSGDQLNVGSSDQMAQLFYGKMGLPVLLRNISKKGEDKRSIFALEGAPSTNENAIRTWMIDLDKKDWQYQALDCVLKIRGVRIRRSLYYKPYPLWQSPTDGRTHPQIRNCGTVTRRPSGTSYNILQVSKTKDQGKIRGVYLPQNEDQLIVSIDFVQQELVIVAGESGDPNLRSCYVGDNRRDVHTLTGHQIYNTYHKDKPNIDYKTFAQLVIDEDQSATEIRKKYAKNTNFLEVYGGSAKGMARKIMVPLKMAEEFDESFHAAYPLIKEYQKRCIGFARRYGYSRTCFGGRRHLPDIYSKNKRKQSAAERQSGNFPIQGGAAEVLKKAMRGYCVERIEERFDPTIYGPIYDEIVASVPKIHVFDYVDAMADIMEIALPGLNISLRTSVSIGKTWGDQIEVGERPTREIIEKTIREIEG